MRILAIDQGTSGTKALVLDSDGTVASLAEVSIRPRYLDGGGVEQDPGELLESVLTAGRRALEDAGGSIDAIALANQGETVLAWDRASGEPLTPAIVWQDNRAQGICDRLAVHAESIVERTGLVLDPYFSAPKMTWLREEWTAHGVVTTSDTWLVHHLTGEFVTDSSTASRSLVLDLDSVDWSDDLLGHFGLERTSMPRLVANDEVVGTTSAFGGDLPVAGLIVDQQAALFAEGCLLPGEMKCTFGTGAFLLANCGPQAARSLNGLTTSVAWQTREGVDYCIDGQVFTAASAVRWLTDLGLVRAGMSLDDAAGGVETDGSRTDDILFVPALAGLAAPWWRSDAQASFAGLSLATGADDLVRAVLLGIAAQVADLVDAMSTDAQAAVSALRVDGGLTHSAVLMQAQADLLQVPVVVYPSAHATALGAASMARLAMNPQLHPRDALVEWEPATVYTPRWSSDRARAYRAHWRARVAATLAKGPGDVGR